MQNQKLYIYNVHVIPPWLCNIQLEFDAVPVNILCVAFLRDVHTINKSKFLWRVSFSSSIALHSSPWARCIFSNIPMFLLRWLFSAWKPQKSINHKKCEKHTTNPSIYCRFSSVSFCEPKKWKIGAPLNAHHLPRILNVMVCHAESLHKHKQCVQSKTFEWKCWWATQGKQNAPLLKRSTGTLSNHHSGSSAFVSWKKMTIFAFEF